MPPNKEACEQSVISLAVGNCSRIGEMLEVGISQFGLFSGVKRVFGMESCLMPNRKMINDNFRTSYRPKNWRPMLKEIVIDTRWAKARDYGTRAKQFHVLW